MPQLNAFVDSLRTILEGTAYFIPRFLAAALALVLGWILALLIKKLVIRVLKWIRVDDFLLKGGVKQMPVTIVANTIYWILLISIWLATFNVFNMDEAHRLFSQVLGYVPNFFVAVILLVMGGLVAGFVSQLLRAYLNNIGMASADILSRLAKFAIFVFAVFLALERLAIDGDIAASAFEILLAGLALAFAIAFGLGGKEHASEIISEFRKKL